MNRTVLFLSSLCLLAGCATDVEMNPNTGQNKSLSFSGLEIPAALGQPVQVSVFHQDVGTYSCTTSSGFFDLPGGTNCNFTGTPVKVAALLDARCTGATCTARIDGAAVEVTGLGAGKAQLDVTARLDDGTVVQDMVELEVAKVDAIGVTIDASYRSIGAHAIFPGTELDLYLWAAAGQRQVERMPEVTAEPEGVVTVDVDRKPGMWSGNYEAQLVVTAKSPGVARLHVKLGAYEEVRTIRVAGFDEVVAGKMFRVAEGYDHDLQWDPVGAPINDVLASSDGTLIVGWILKDGTLALGGAEKVSASVFGFVAAYASPDDANWVTAMYVKPSVIRAGSTVTMRGQFGAGSMDHTFRVDP